MKPFNENWDGIDRSRNLSENVGIRMGDVGIRHWTNLDIAAKQIGDMSKGPIGKTLQPKLSAMARSLTLVAKQQDDFLQGLISELDGIKRSSNDMKTRTDLDRTIAELKKYQKR